MATVVTRKGKDMLSADVSQFFWLAPTPMDWGTNPSALTAAATDIALFKTSTEARVSGTGSVVTTTTTNDTYQTVGTITAGGVRAITEVGLFESTTKPATATVTTGASSIIGSSSNTALFTTATYSPGTNNYIQIRTEVMQVTAGNGTTALTVVRAQGGSAAIATIAASDNVSAGNIAGNSAVTGGSCFLHADFTAINLALGDSIQFTLQVQFT